MGQKVNPIGMRIGIIRSWDSKWFASKKDVPALIKEDFKIRQYLNKVYKNAAVAQIEIERLKGKSLKDKNKTVDKVKLTIHTAKPGFVIGRDAETKKKAVEGLEKIINKEVVMNVVEVRRPERVAVLVAQNMADQLENRASFRRVQKIAIQRALKSGARGCKTSISGRLGGAEMARSEGYSEGRVPLHTFRADIDYAVAEAHTTYGKLGIKVWIYNGDVLPGQTREENLKKQDEKFGRRDDNKKRPPRNNDFKPRQPREDAKGGK